MLRKFMCLSYVSLNSPSAEPKAVASFKARTILNNQNVEFREEIVEEPKQGYPNTPS
jgi:hypothetical protein